jgi:hypothetical protein
VNEVEYERMQEDAAIGAIMAGCAADVFDHYGVRTLAELSREVYKSTVCGAFVVAKLHSGQIVAVDHDEAKDPRLVVQIRAIGVGSIIEGSDIVIGPEWVDFFEIATSDEEFDEPEFEASAAFVDLVEMVDEDAGAAAEELVDKMERRRAAPDDGEPSGV